MYFATVDPASGHLVSLRMTPLRVRRMQLSRTSREEAAWLTDRRNDVSRAFGARAELTADGTLMLAPA